MRRTVVAGLLSILACAAWASSGYAGWFVRTPWVSVSGGPGVSVQAPFVDVRVGPPAGRVIVVPPPPPPVVVPAPPPVIVKVPTLEEFAATFHPAPGNYEVTILHSRSGCPVTVCFTLPPGCPKVCVQRHQLDFKYPCEDVRIRCQIFGKVKVSYH
jgi:hypothetical protein